MNPYEHFSKEILKQAAENNPNFSDRVKADVKMIIEAAQTPEELVIAF